jgi:Peptidase family M28
MRRLLPLFLLLASCTTVRAPPPAPAFVTDAEIRSTIAELSGDDYEGRMPGTPGGDKTTAYLAGRFRSAGLVDGKLGGGPYLQPVIVDRKPGAPIGPNVKLPPGQRHFIAEMDKRGRFTTYNVVGKVSGRQPDGRAVVVMAHWDHLGLCMPEGAPDRICNGAVDNASGIAAMLAVAERVRKMKLDRDVWFVATAAEEWGLLGAKAFAEKPPLPLDKIVAGFNLDTIAIASKGMPVAIVAPKGSPLEPIVRDAAKAVGRAWDGDDEAGSFIRRQDGWALSERGVPMIMAGGSFSDFKLLTAFLASRYHHPDDELRPDTDLGGAVDDANLHVELVRRTASQSYRPSFDGVPKIE